MIAEAEAKDITDGWKLYRCDNGTYDAKHKDSDHDGYDYHNLGNGKTELSAWVELRDILASNTEDTYPTPVEALRTLKEAAQDALDNTRALRVEYRQNLAAAIAEAEECLRRHK